MVEILNLLAMDYPELAQIMKQAATGNVILDLQVESSEGIKARKAILKDFQIHPVKGTYLHVDFYEVSSDREITVNIPIHLINTPIGATNGGILQHIRRELTISCLPDKLMASIDIDISDLDIGDSIHISDINLPEGLKSAEEGRLTVAVMAAPTVVEEEAPEEELEEQIGEEETLSEAEGTEGSQVKEKGGE